MASDTGKTTGFEGQEVVAFESRRAKETAALITHYGGIPRLAPCMREVPLAENAAAFEFAEKLFARQLDAMVCMTGVGMRTLVEAIETRYPREKIVEALSKINLVARGPKPASVLRELRIPVTITVPEPNTWREILQELDENPRGFSLEGSRVAVQEYGIANEKFLEELRARGAEVMRVPVYRWALPEDIGPLLDALAAILEGRARIVLFTSRVQVEHVLRVASERGFRERFLSTLHSCVICSIGPTCSEALLARGIAIDLEPEHPKMGVLVNEAAKQGLTLLRQKRVSNNGLAPNLGRIGNGGGNPLLAKDPSRACGSYAAIQSVQPETPPAVGAKPWENSCFMKACRLEPTERTPVWLMRQAGRYMKDYRELRSRVPFLELCKRSELAAELTVRATQELGVDAAIIFTDLLLIVEPLGLGLEYDKGEGPVISPVLRQASDLRRMRDVEPRESLPYLYDAIRMVRERLDDRIPLIGFGAAPFTLASYMIEGGGSKSFRYTKTLMYRDRGAWNALMEHLVCNLIKYINGQIEAGVQAVQIFDTWVGCLGPEDYREFVLPYSRALIRGIAPGVPIIHFGTGTGPLLEDMKEAGGNVIGLDFHVELDQAWGRLGAGVGVQGNLDPLVLFAEPAYIRRRVQKILDQAAGRPGHIFNLGHGILPDTPYENVVELVRIVHEFSGKQKSSAKTQ